MSSEPSSRHLEGSARCVVSVLWKVWAPDRTGSAPLLRPPRPFPTEPSLASPQSHGPAASMPSGFCPQRSARTTCTAGLGPILASPGAQFPRQGSLTACCPPELPVWPGAWARLRLPHLPAGCFSAGTASPPSSRPVLVNTSVPPCCHAPHPAVGLQSPSPGPHPAVFSYCVHGVRFSVNPTREPGVPSLCCPRHTRAVTGPVPCQTSSSRRHSPFLKRAARTATAARGALRIPGFCP